MEDDNAAGPLSNQKIIVACVLFGIFMIIRAVLVYRGKDE